MLYFYARNIIILCLFFFFIIKLSEQQQQKQHDIEQILPPSPTESQQQRPPRQQSTQNEGITVSNDELPEILDQVQDSMQELPEIQENSDPKLDEFLFDDDESNASHGQKSCDENVIGLHGTQSASNTNNYEQTKESKQSDNRETIGIQRYKITTFDKSNINQLQDDNHGETVEIRVQYNDMDRVNDGNVDDYDEFHVDREDWMFNDDNVNDMEAIDDMDDIEVMDVDKMDVIQIKEEKVAEITAETQGTAVGKSGFIDLSMSSDEIDRNSQSMQSNRDKFVIPTSDDEDDDDDIVDLSLTQQYQEMVDQQQRKRQQSLNIMHDFSKEISWIGINNETFHKKYYPMFDTKSSTFICKGYDIPKFEGFDIDKITNHLLDDDMTQYMYVDGRENEAKWEEYRTFVIIKDGEPEFGLMFKQYIINGQKSLYLIVTSNKNDPATEQRLNNKCKSIKEWLLFTNHTNLFRKQAEEIKYDLVKTDGEADESMTAISHNMVWYAVIDEFKRKEKDLWKFGDLNEERDGLSITSNKILSNFTDIFRECMNDITAHLSRSYIDKLKESYRTFIVKQHSNLKHALCTLTRYTAIPDMNHNYKDISYATTTDNALVKLIWDIDDDCNYSTGPKKSHYSIIFKGKDANNPHSNLLHLHIKKNIVKSSIIDNDINGKLKICPMYLKNHIINIQEKINEQPIYINRAHKLFHSGSTETNYFIFHHKKDQDPLFQRTKYNKVGVRDLDIRRCTGIKVCRNNKCSRVGISISNNTLYHGGMQAICSECRKSMEVISCNHYIVTYYGAAAILNDGNNKNFECLTMIIGEHCNECIQIGIMAVSPRQSTKCFLLKEAALLSTLNASQFHIHKFHHTDYSEAQCIGVFDDYFQGTQRAKTFIRSLIRKYNQDLGIKYMDFKAFDPTLGSISKYWKNKVFYYDVQDVNQIVILLHRQTMDYWINQLASHQTGPIQINALEEAITDSNINDDQWKQYLCEYMSCDATDWFMHGSNKLLDMVTFITKSNKFIPLIFGISSNEDFISYCCIFSVLLRECYRVIKSWNHIFAVLMIIFDLDSASRFGIKLAAALLVSDYDKYTQIMDSMQMVKYIKELGDNERVRLCGYIDGWLKQNGIQRDLIGPDRMHTINVFRRWSKRLSPSLRPSFMSDMNSVFEAVDIETGTKRLSNVITRWQQYDGIKARINLLTQPFYIKRCMPWANILDPTLIFKYKCFDHSNPIETLHGQLKDLGGRGRKSVVTAAKQLYAMMDSNYYSYILGNGSNTGSSNKRDVLKDNAIKGIQRWKSGAKGHSDFVHGGWDKLGNAAKCHATTGLKSTDFHCLSGKKDGGVTIKLMYWKNVINGSKTSLGRVINGPLSKRGRRVDIENSFICKMVHIHQQYNAYPALVQKIDKIHYNLQMHVINDSIKPKTYQKINELFKRMKLSSNVSDTMRNYWGTRKKLQTLDILHCQLPRAVSDYFSNNNIIFKPKLMDECNQNIKEYRMDGTFCRIGEAITKKKAIWIIFYYEELWWMVRISLINGMLLCSWYNDNICYTELKKTNGKFRKLHSAEYKLINAVIFHYGITPDFHTTVRLLQQQKAIWESMVIGSFNYYNVLEDIYDELPAELKSLLSFNNEFIMQCGGWCDDMKFTKNDYHILHDEYEKYVTQIFNELSTKFVNHSLDPDVLHKFMTYYNRFIIYKSIHDQLLVHKQHNKWKQYQETSDMIIFSVQGEMAKMKKRTFNNGWNKLGITSMTAIKDSNNGDNDDNNDDMGQFDDGNALIPSVAISMGMIAENNTSWNENSMDLMNNRSNVIASGNLMNSYNNSDKTINFLHTNLKIAFLCIKNMDAFENKEDLNEKVCFEQDELIKDCKTDTFQCNNCLLHFHISCCNINGHKYKVNKLNRWICGICSGLNILYPSPYKTNIPTIPRETVWETLTNYVKEINGSINPNLCGLIGDNKLFIKAMHIIFSIKLISKSIYKHFHLFRKTDSFYLVGAVMAAMHCKNVLDLDDMEAIFVKFCERARCEMDKSEEEIIYTLICELIYEMLLTNAADKWDNHLTSTLCDIPSLMYPHDAILQKHCEITDENLEQILNESVTMKFRPLGCILMVTFKHKQHDHLQILTTINDKIQMAKYWKLKLVMVANDVYYYQQQKLYHIRNGIMRELPEDHLSKLSKSWNILIYTRGKMPIYTPNLDIITPRPTTRESATYRQPSPPRQPPILSTTPSKSSRTKPVIIAKNPITSYFRSNANTNNMETVSNTNDTEVISEPVSVANTIITETVSNTNIMDYDENILDQEPPSMEAISNDENIMDYDEEIDQEPPSMEPISNENNKQQRRNKRALENALNSNPKKKRKITLTPTLSTTSNTSTAISTSTATSTSNTTNTSTAISNTTNNSSLRRRRSPRKDPRGYKYYGIGNVKGTQVLENEMNATIKILALIPDQHQRLNYVMEHRHVNQVHDWLISLGYTAYKTATFQAQCIVFLREFKHYT